MHIEPQEMDKTASNREDACLITAFLEGRQSAFDELFYKYRDRLFSLCFRFLGSRSDAEDVLQETFIDIHKGLGGFRSDAAFATWAYKITVRRCYYQLSRRKLSTPLPNELILVDTAPQMNQIDRIAVRHGLAKLSNEFRMLLILRYYQQFTYEEIGRVLSYDVNKVKRRLHRARLCLKKTLEEETDGGLI